MINTKFDDDTNKLKKDPNYTIYISCLCFRESQLKIDHQHFIIY